MCATIKAKLEYLKSLPFPAFAEDDTLSDWQSELAECEGYLAGLASRALGGERIDAKTVARIVHRLRAGLEAIGDLPPEDHDICDQCELYVVALEDLVESLLL